MGGQETLHSRQEQPLRIGRTRSDETTGEAAAADGDGPEMQAAEDGEEPGVKRCSRWNCRGTAAGDEAAVGVETTG